MGPSGSGKTTLMNIIGCLDRQTKGEFYLAGTDVAALKDKELSHLRLNSIGFVFQSFHLLPRESALENVSLPLSYAGIKKKERKERGLSALARVGLEDQHTFCYVKSYLEVKRPRASHGCENVHLLKIACISETVPSSQPGALPKTKGREEFSLLQ